MSLSNKRDTGPCHCTHGCPPYTWRYGMYAVKTNFIDIGSNYISTGVLYEFKQRLGSLACLYKPRKPIFPGWTEEMRFEILPNPPAGYAGWSCDIVINAAGAILANFRVEKTWELPGDVPSDPDDEANCSRIELTVPAVGIPPPVACFITALYPDACVDADIPAKKMRKQCSSLP